jgi:tRNA 2-thiouridine synthesizing protein A
LQVDARGLRCPLPILRTKKALAQVLGGERVEVFATDPNALGDFEAFCRHTGHTLLTWEEADGRFRFLLQKRTEPG